MRAPVVLHAISSFDQDTLENAAIPVTEGLSRAIISAGALRSELTNSPDFWSILQRLHQNQEAGGMVFDILESIVAFTPPAITSDNYEAAVNLAKDIAAAGSVGAIEEQRRDPSRRSKAGKQAKAQYVFYPLSVFSLQLILTKSAKTPS